MPVLFSRACEYALRALFEMARHPKQEFWTIQELADRTDTPAPFLAKTFQSLVKGEILISNKGRHGGFAFARAPQKISLIKIVEMIDGPALAYNCALGLPTCSNDEPCPFHAHWKAIRDSITNALQHQTLAPGKAKTKLRRSATRLGNGILKTENLTKKILQP
jgi:Rrf2 family protein